MSELRIRIETEEYIYEEYVELEELIYSIVVDIYLAPSIS